MPESPSEATISKRSAWAALALLVPVPAVGAALALLILPDTAVGKAAFLLAKLWILLLPVAWHRWVDGRPIRLPRPSRRGMGLAVASGLLIVAAIGGAYLLVGRHWIDEAAVRRTAEGAGLALPVAYLLGAVYWCTFNSLAEEYIWRWFVFTRWRAVTGAGPAVALAALCFTLHHVVALSAYFDARVTVLASLGVFIGGAVWTWLYRRTGNLYAAYVSHVFADLIIFYLGWRMIF